MKKKIWEHRKTTYFVSEVVSEILQTVVKDKNIYIYSHFKCGQFRLLNHLLV